MSLLLGTTPDRCESIESTTPSIGIAFDSGSPRIAHVTPRMPADSAGLRQGMVVRAIDDEQAASGAALLQLIRSHLKVGEPLTVETTTGTFQPVPVLANEEQCYWEVGAGSIHRSSAGVSVVSGVGASGRAGSATYNRFYRLTGRFFNGSLSRFASNWQF